MTGRFADFEARLEGRASEEDGGRHHDEPENQPEEEKSKGKPKKDDTEMTDEEHKAALEQARSEGSAKGFAEANSRAADVIASEHFTGNEALAAKLLRNDKLTGEEVIDYLATAGKPTKSSAQPDPQPGSIDAEEMKEAAEEAGRTEMRSELDKNKPSEIEANEGGPAKTAEQKADDVWDKAGKNVGRNAKKEG